ncbi:unnamed protein product, partial [Prorocentrum cordatum]
ASLMYDQLVIIELASYEHLARQLQFIDDRFYEEKVRRIAVARHDAMSTEGNLCICPALTQFIAEQMNNEATVPKESRK